MRKIISKKRFTGEQIISKPREAEVFQSNIHYIKIYFVND